MQPYIRPLGALLKRPCCPSWCLFRCPFSSSTKLRFLTKYCAAVENRVEQVHDDGLPSNGLAKARTIRPQGDRDQEQSHRFSSWRTSGLRRSKPDPGAARYGRSGANRIPCGQPATARPKGSIRCQVGRSHRCGRAARPTLTDLAASFPPRRKRCCVLQRMDCHRRRRIAIRG